MSGFDGGDNSGGDVPDTHHSYKSAFHVARRDPKRGYWVPIRMQILLGGRVTRPSTHAGKGGKLSDRLGRARV